jgi:outer membrane protein assembly complex protein YaeT
MSTRQRLAVILLAFLLAATALLAQDRASSNSAIVIDEIRFVGLRRISPEALTDKILCGDGQAVSAERVAQDVRTLGQLGWFDTVRVESEPIAPQRVRLTYVVPELPFVTAVEYSGSRLLSRRQIDKLLGEKKLAPKLGEPENRAALHRAAAEIENALRELGHPQASVVPREEKSPNATVRLRFQIDDGPHVAVREVKFTGNPAISKNKLRRQMQQIRPTALLAGLRGKDIYTEQRFAQDRVSLLTYYQNHGYPEARVASPMIHQYQKPSPKWLPWPRRASQRLQIQIPVEAGPLYAVASVQASESLAGAFAANHKSHPLLNTIKAGSPYSAQAVENLRRAWEAQVRRQFRSRKGPQLPDSASLRTVEVTRTPDTAAHTMRIDFHLSDSPPYTVRRLQFEGMRRFPDRYFRKRMILKEGAPLDDRALELGLARLGRTGYFKPIKKEDVRVQTNEAAHTADVTVRVEELGKQRVSLVGGRGQFGSTLGIAYMLYNVLDREELLSSRIEAGPETVELAIGFAKEGFLGSRGTLALSLFNTFLRPRLTGAGKGPFFNQHTEGLSADYSYALTSTDSTSIDYGISHSVTQYSLALPPGLTGLPASEVAAKSSSHSLGAGWEHNTGNEKLAFADSVSGGWLGGSENLLRTKGEYGRIFHDGIFDSRNAWAFHTSLNAVGSYAGEMPPYARWFGGDQFVRGLRDGELGPLGVLATISTSGATTYSAAPLGANAIGVVNGEYRVPLGAGTEAATFFDLGSGRLLPNWLGPNRPSIIDSTNGVLHGSTGLELRWTIPGVGVPVRVYYALNVLRLNRVLTLPDASLFRAHNHFSAFGWGLGSLF